MELRFPAMDKSTTLIRDFLPSERTSDSLQATNKRGTWDSGCGFPWADVSGYKLAGRIFGTSPVSFRRTGNHATRPNWRNENYSGLLLKYLDQTSRDHSERGETWPLLFLEPTEKASAAKAPRCGLKDTNAGSCGKKVRWPVSGSC